MEWININDNIPKNNQKVKIKSENYWHGEAIFEDGKFKHLWVKGSCFGKETHWMPLSEKPCHDQDLECEYVNIMILPPKGKTFKECILCKNPFVYDRTSENCLWCEINKNE